MTQSQAGRFVWRELVTPQVDQATSFYGNLFGWTAAAQDMGGMVYTMLKAGAHDVGGATTPQMDGVPPHWLDYITVDNADAAAALVTELGGQLLVPPFDIANVGRAAIVQDPQGAVFAAFQSLTPGATDTDAPAADHTFCWSELMAKNVDAIVPFYTGLFGWTAEAMGPGAVMFKHGEKMMASARQLPDDQATPPHWLQYVQVADVDEAYAKAGTLGGTPMMGPQEIAGMGTFAILRDPTGAGVALWKNA